MIAIPVTQSAKSVLHNYKIIFGPPGTGKTTTLEHIIEKYVLEYGPDSVMVTSYTRGAAAELVRRVPQVPSTNVRTLHSFGYAAIGGNKPIAEQNITSWNKHAENECGKTDWKLTPASVVSDETTNDDAASGTLRNKGDAYLAKINFWRAKGVEAKLWPVEAGIRNMYMAWNEWKTQNGYVDFNDMIEIPLRDNLPPPTKARFFIVDEAQDSTAQQIKLVRQWGEYMQEVTIALDDDQALYYFSGGDPEACLDLPIPPENRMVLSQSYRVPRAVHEFAQRWIEESVHRREQKLYLPRDYEGEVRVIEPNTENPREGTYHNPGRLIEDAENRYLMHGKTVMFLATCSYMLKEVEGELRRRGIPFHNPYRKQRPDWNPLTPQKGVASSKRILSFLRPQYAVYGEHFRMWNIEEFLEWSDVLYVDGVFRSGGRKAAERYYASLNGDRDLISRELEFTEQQLGGWLTEEAQGFALDGDLEWYKSKITASKMSGMHFPLTIVTTRGAQALMEGSHVIIGTIHSVKGGQADAVYLFPDTSIQSNQSSATPNSRDMVLRQFSENEAYRGFIKRDNRMRIDSIKRVFYVGMTRAIESLILCPPAPGSGMHMSPHEDLEGFYKNRNRS